MLDIMATLDQRDLQGLQRCTALRLLLVHRKQYGVQMIVGTSSTAKCMMLTQGHVLLEGHASCISLQGTHSRKPMHCTFAHCRSLTIFPYSTKKPTDAGSTPKEARNGSVSAPPAVTIMASFKLCGSQQHAGLGCR